MSNFETNRLIRAMHANLSELLCAQTAASSITVQPQCDDTSGEVVAYVVITYDPTAGTVATTYFDASFNSIDSLPDGSSPCADDGLGGNLVPEYTILSGAGTWTMGATTTSVSIYVDTVDDILNRPTLQTTSGTSDLYQDLTLQWGDGSSLLDQPLVVTTTEAGDLIFITYTTQ